MQLVTEIASASQTAIRRRLVVRAVDHDHAVHEAESQLALSGAVTRDVRVEAQLDACLFTVEATVLLN